MTHGNVPHASTAVRRIATRLLAGIILAGMLAGFGGPAAALADDNYRTGDGLAAYLGVQPAQIVRGHPSAHPERRMHGGPPAGRHDYHLVVAVFDAASGARIEDAEVTAVVSGLGHVGRTSIRLEPMRLADAVTYGGFVTLPGTDQYTIAVEVLRRGQGAPVRLEFGYRHAR
jgi:hypothetical protein